MILWPRFYDLGQIIKGASIGISDPFEMPSWTKSHVSSRLNIIKIWDITRLVIELENANSHSTLENRMNGCGFR